jgi:transposase
MKRLPQGRYTPEFREQAVKLVTDEGLKVTEAARRLSMPKATLNTWVLACREGTLAEVGKNYKPLNEVELELARVKKELAEVKVERDLLKKAAAYFAKESR